MNPRFIAFVDSWVLACTASLPQGLIRYCAWERLVFWSSSFLLSRHTVIIARLLSAGPREPPKYIPNMGREALPPSKQIVVWTLSPAVCLFFHIVTDLRPTSLSVLMETISSPLLLTVVFRLGLCLLLLTYKLPSTTTESEISVAKQGSC